MDVRAVIAVSTADVPVFGCLLDALKPGFHIVVSVVSVVSIVRKKFIGQILLYGNLPYKCSIQKKRQIQLVVRDRMNSIGPTNFFRTTDSTIWKPGLRVASVETRVETQETFRWMKKRCNVLCDAYVVATADFCHSFYFMTKLYGHK